VNSSEGEDAVVHDSIRSVVIQITPRGLVKTRVPLGIASPQTSERFRG